MLVVVDCFVEANILLCAQTSDARFILARSYLSVPSTAFTPGPKRCSDKSSWHSSEKIKSSQNNFWKRLVITNYGLWTCVDRAELGKTDWREEKQENVVANTEIRIQFEKGRHNPQNKIENLDEIDLCLDSMFIFEEETCRLQCVISKTLVLPQRYFT